MTGNAFVSKLLPILVFMFPVSFTGIWGIEEIDYYDFSNEPSVENSHWMSNLSDSLLISELSIPGTHDTVSFYGGNFVQTQSWPLSQQLRAGIRFLDIRCRHFYDTLPIYHGSIYQYTFFNDVIRDVEEFLSDCPSETVIMRVKGEYVAVGNNETMFETVNRYLDMFSEDLYWTYGHVPTLGEVRGKIVIVKDFYGPPIGLDYRDLQIEAHWEVWSLFFGEIEEKWLYITLHLSKSVYGERSALYVTFTNGAGLFAFPYAVAQLINPQLLAFLEATRQTPGRLGIIVMDFPGGLLVERIIQRNFVTF